MWSAPSGSVELRSPRLRAKRPLDYELLAGGVSDSDLTDILKKRITDIQALRDQDAKEITYLESGADYYDFFSIKVAPSVVTSVTPVPPPLTPVTPSVSFATRPMPLIVQTPTQAAVPAVPLLSAAELREKQAAEGSFRLGPIIHAVP